MHFEIREVKLATMKHKKFHRKKEGVEPGAVFLKILINYAHFMQSYFV